MRPKSGSTFSTSRRLAPAMPYILATGGLLGLICSAIISYDAQQLLKNPTFNPSCNLNPVLSCGSVLHSTVSDVFGFPNAWIGIAGFSAILTVGVAMLAGATFKRWFWRVYYCGLVAAAFFAYWMLWQSIFTVKALCPFCLAVDVTVTALVWYVSFYVTREGYLPVPRRFIGMVDFARRHHLELLVIWYLLIAGLIVYHFWYYYGKYI